MNIEEMHVTFRELAQQMGIQTVRAILPENIDICLNIAIVDIVKEIIATTVGYHPQNDKITRNNAAVASINGLRTLYKKNTIIANFQGEGSMMNPFTTDIIDFSVMIYTGFKVSYDGKTLYDCRIIENEDLGQTIHDYCNRPTKEHPICNVYGKDNSIKIDFVTGANTFAKPTHIQYLYIEQPVTVLYDEEDTTKNINCNLPIHLHQDVVKRAVDVYLRSIGAISKSKNND